MTAPVDPDSDWLQRFAGIGRLYGARALERLGALHVCVVGVGGVGSWTAEALARSGVGRITLIDHDTVAASNANRQLHTLTETFERKKIAVLAERIAGINPRCAINPIDDFLTLDNIEVYLALGYDHVVDAIDSIKFKAGLIYWCRRNKVPVTATGGAGGRIDPTRVRVRDLNRTQGDPLAARVRARLREHYGWTRNPKRYFGVECVHSDEPPRYPRPDGGVGLEKPGIHGVHLDCSLGYGAAGFVTGTFGFVAASRVITKALEVRP